MMENYGRALNEFHPVVTKRLIETLLSWMFAKFVSPCLGQKAPLQSINDDKPAKNIVCEMTSALSKKYCHIVTGPQSF